MDERRRGGSLPQLAGRAMVTDGGMETDLIFHHGVDLPEFAAFVLLTTETGRSLLTNYYDGYAEVAHAAGAGLVLESPTWRANPDWGDRLGYGAADLDRVNREAIALMDSLRARYAPAIDDVVISGMIGPRGDGYRPGSPADPSAMAAYHLPQIESFAAAGADLVTAYTLTDPGEAIGIATAAREVGIPVGISFTVETDGRLPGGMSVEQAVDAVDETCAPDYFLLNCAHPLHVGAGIGGGEGWADRVVGLRCNASTQSHAELDESEVLDEGDLTVFVDAHEELRRRFPRLSVLGGCCGTDRRHVAALWGVGADRQRSTGYTANNSAHRSAARP